jgi:hypothetical protein
MFTIIEVLVALAAVAGVVYVVWAVIGTSEQSPRRVAPTTARWEAAHYAVGPSTHVVVRKKAQATGDVLDEHLLAVIPDDDPDWDMRFLEAMAQARARAALLESES